MLQNWKEGLWNPLIDIWRQSNTKNIILHILVTMFLWAHNEQASDWIPSHVRPLLFLSCSLSFFCPVPDRHDFCYSLFFPPSIIQWFSTFLYLCHLSPPHISVSLFLFVSSHPSILLAGWPKSCAVWELCSGRYKVSVALCSHTFPLLSSCIHCMHEKETGRQRGLGSKEWENEKRRKEGQIQRSMAT